MKYFAVLLAARCGPPFLWERLEFVGYGHITDMCFIVRVCISTGKHNSGSFCNHVVIIGVMIITVPQVFVQIAKTNVQALGYVVLKLGCKGVFGIAVNVIIADQKWRCCNGTGICREVF